MRKKTSVVKIGNVLIGGENPVVIQTMTNTKTTDIKGTIEQIQRCVDAGAEIVRVSVPDIESANAMKTIVRNSPVPLVADIHYNYKRGIDSIKAGAACIRINPGNITQTQHRIETIKACKDYNVAIRIGVNAGSLDEKYLKKYGEPNADALVESAMECIKLTEDEDFHNFKISVKASDVRMMIEAYQKLSNLTEKPLHLGLTEAGGRTSGTVKSSIALGYLLLNGIGDTIRVSTATEPEYEIEVCKNILRSIGMYDKGVNIIACPSCARQGFIVNDVVLKIEQATAHLKDKISISILGCGVNGFGEAHHTDVGIIGMQNGQHEIWKKGQFYKKATDDILFEEIMNLVQSLQ